MCLAIPGKVIEIFEKDGLPFGRIDFSGTTGEACLLYTPEVEVGMYAIVHAGFVLNILDEEEAQKTLELFEEMAAAGVFDFSDELGLPPEPRDDAEGSGD